MPIPYRGPRLPWSLASQLVRERRDYEVVSLDAQPGLGIRIGVVTFWAVIGPLFWPIDVINSARQGQLPKT